MTMKNSPCCRIFNLMGSDTNCNLLSNSGTRNAWVKSPVSQKIIPTRTRSPQGIRVNRNWQWYLKWRTVTAKRRIALKNKRTSTYSVRLLLRKEKASLMNRRRTFPSLLWASTTRKRRSLGNSWCLNCPGRWSRISSKPRRNPSSPLLAPRSMSRGPKKNSRMGGLFTRSIRTGAPVHIFQMDRNFRETGKKRL